LNNCTTNRFIPIWLVVSGAFAAFQQLGALFDRVRKKKSGDDCEEGEENNTPGICRCFNGLIGCFNLAWFIVGKAFYLNIQNTVVHNLTC